MVHFLQSPAWGDFQRSLGREVVTDSGEGWSYLAVVERGKGNTRLYVPYGPVCQDETSFLAALASLKQQAVQRKLTFIRIEPTATFSPLFLEKQGLKKVDYQHLQPEATRLIDLSRSEEDVLAAMSQNSRNLTRNYANKGLTISHSQRPEDIDHLLNLLHAVAMRTGLRTHSDEYFRLQAKTLLDRGAATIYFANFDGQPVAAAMVYDDAETRYYAHAAADDTHRKLQAGTALVGQMILDAKCMGKQQFDLYGITLSDDPTHPWAGFSRFKQSFGGKSVVYSGAYDVPLKPLPYALYRTYQELRARIRGK